MDVEVIVMILDATERSSFEWIRATMMHELEMHELDGLFEIWSISDDFR